MGLFWCFLLGLLVPGLGFNVDIASRTVHRGDPDSMFGFTVQSHVDGHDKLLLVGAPKADPKRIQDLVKPGAVFKCRPDSPGACSELIFDRAGNNVDKQNRPIDNKSNQWFGATLSSTGLNGPIVACATRYVSYVTAAMNHHDPVGACFVLQSPRTSESKEFSPCRSFVSNVQQRRTGVCQAGFSAAFSKDGERLFMGAPGSWYWQGRTFSIDPKENFHYFMPKMPEGQLYSGQAKKFPLLSTLEGPESYDDSYMGYSLTVGDFAGQAVQGVAVGIPRGYDLKGLIVIYTWELDNIKNVTGSQIGAYFGYCLASGDIDGDGFDDLIVGAPMYTRTKTDGYEHGRVYVIYQGSSRSFTKHDSRTGDVSRGRFGLSVASLGDINLDGFGDFAVGAPYGGANGRGAVYIYHGSAKGVSEKYSQVITAEEVDPVLSTFGFSLSGGIDLDNNNYTDLAVGAYKSDSVVFFRSRPVVKVMAEFKFMSKSKLISLDEKSCPLDDGTTASCAKLIYCLSYDGINVDEQIKFEVTLDLDSKQTTHKRLFVKEGRSSTYRKSIYLVKGKQECSQITIYLQEEIRDKLTPLEVAMSYDLVSHRVPGVIPPVLDQTLKNVYSDSLHIQKNCGQDNICVPDLQMAVTTPNVNYILASNENVNITVEVENRGQDAFEASYHLYMPRGVTYANMKRYEEESTAEMTVYCSIHGRDPSGNSTLRCDLGNPLPGGAKVKFQVVLEVDPTVSALEFDMEVNSTNPEVGTQYDNHRHLSIGVIAKANLNIIGTSDPPELHYNASLYEVIDIPEDTKLGPQVIHKYNIKNEGPFSVDEAEIYIMWPYQTLDGADLMYMLIQPQTVGPIQCNRAGHVNPADFFVKNPYTFYLQKELEAYESSEFGSGKFERRFGVSQGGRRFNEDNNNLAANSSRESYYKQTFSSGNQGSYGQGGSSHTQGTYGQSQGNYGQNQGSYGQSQSGQGQSEGIYTYRRTQGGQSQGNSDNSEVNYGQNRQSYGQSLGSYGQNQGSYGQSQGSYGQSQGSYGQSQGSYGQTQGSYGHGQSRSEQSGYGRETYRQNAGSYGNQENLGNSENTRVQGHVSNGITRQWNKTVTYDKYGNIVSETETSTQFGSLGHEGEAGSSFSQRYGGSDEHNRFMTSDNKHSWSTEESINKDLMNANSYNRHASSGSASVTSVDDDEDDQISGFAANAALNKNNEFRVGVADLGISGSGNSASGSSGSGYSSQSSGSYGGAGQGSARYGASYSRSGSAGSGNSYSYSSSSGSSQTGAGEYSYSSRSHASDNSHFRGKRQDDVDPELKEMLTKCEEKFKCEVVKCVTGTLMKGQEVWVALRSRIKASVLNEISQDRTVKLSTMATTRVTRLSQVGKPKEAPWKTAEAQTVITPQLEAPTSGEIPLWVIILAAIVGALLLLLLIFALYKCGFFKRNRPSDRSEREPLNRDEHL